MAQPTLANRCDLDIPRPYQVFMADVQNPTDAKTGFGLVEWRRDWCAAQWRLPGCAVDLGLPELAPHAARNHQTQEHFLQLFVALGAGGTAATSLHQSMKFSALRMDAFEFAT